MIGFKNNSMEGVLVEASFKAAVDDLVIQSEVLGGQSEDVGN